MLETNEILALVFVLLATAATVAVHRHHSNTPRTREWWGRFLILVAFVLVAQVATNVEEVVSDQALAGSMNLLEHASLLAAAAWALALTGRGLAERHARLAEGGGDAR